MNRLIRLYPAAWRARYGDELLALLAERPPTARDRIDIVRGAFDARIHPQVFAPDGEGGSNVATQLAGASAVVGGILWALGGLVMNATPITPRLGYKEVNTGLLAMLAGTVLFAIAALLVSRALARRGRVGMGAAITIAAGAALMALPWPFVGIGIMLGAMVGPAIFGFATYRTTGHLAAAIVGLAAIVVLFFNTEDGRALLTVPYGVAWALFGLDVAIRRPGPRAVPAPVG